MKKRSKDSENSQQTSKRLSLEEAWRRILQSDDELSLTSDGNRSGIETDSDGTDDTDIYDPAGSASNNTGKQGTTWTKSCPNVANSTFQPPHKPGPLNLVSSFTAETPKQSRTLNCILKKTCGFV